MGNMIRMPRQGIDYIMGLAFGGRETYATKRLAINAQDAQIFGEGFELPLIAQWAILVNMERIKPTDFSIDSQTVGSAPREAQMTTRQAMEIARDYVVSEFGRDSLKSALYVAHPAHMERVIAIGKKLDFRGIPFVDKEVIWNTGQESLGAGATVSPQKWRRRELVTRAHHLLKGWT